MRIPAMRAALRGAARRLLLDFPSLLHPSLLRSRPGRAPALVRNRSNLETDDIKWDVLK